MEHIKNFLDAASTYLSIATIGAWFAGILTPLAAFVSIMWIGFQWYHSAPMKEWRADRKDRKANP